VNRMVTSCYPSYGVALIRRVVNRMCICKSLIASSLPTSVRELSVSLKSFLGNHPERAPVPASGTMHRWVPSCALAVISRVGRTRFSIGSHQRSWASTNEIQTRRGFGGATVNRVLQPGGHQSSQLEPMFTTFRVICLARFAASPQRLTRHGQ